MASLISKASLLMVPSVYEDGTLYNVLPSGNKAPDETGNHNGYDQTRADFTFSRGSNLAATRVNADGLIEKGRENLLLQSNQFDTTWINSNSSETSGQSGYDGTNDAWLINKSAANGYIRQAISQSGVQTLSVYAKAGTLNWMRVIADGGSSTPSTWFDLENGVIGSADFFTIDSNIESVGNDWHRCSISFEVGTIAGVRFYPADGNNDVSGTSGSIYIQNAQLEYGLAASSYLDSGATTATAGVLENTPRIDYSSGAGSLKLEPQRTNSMSHSEYIGAYFFYANASASNNQAISPEGVVNAASIIPNATNGIHQIASSNISASGSFTLSAFVKAGELNKVAIRDSYATGAYATFNLSTGTKIEDNVSGDAFIEPFENDWYRIGVTYTHSGNIRLGINILDNSYTTGNPSSGTNYWSSNGTDKLYVYGLQCELAASYPSSYVPTYGSAATRGADSCSVTGVSDVIGQTEGTLYVEFEFSKDIDAPYRVSLSDGTTNNRIQLGTYGNEVQVYVQTSGVTQVFAFGGTISIGIHKMALAYATNDYVAYLDGSAVITDTSASVPACSKLEYRIPDGTGLFEHPIKQQVLFNERLSNSELATLTTL